MLIGLAAPRPTVVACVDADPLSEAAVAVVAARVTAARVVPRLRCPVAGHRVRIVDRRGTMLELQTPDGRRLRRRLPWLASAEGGWMQTAMADQLGVLAARLAGLLAEAQLSAPAGPIAAHVAEPPPEPPPATPKPRPASRRRIHRSPPARPQKTVVNAAPAHAITPAPPAPLPPAPPPEGSILSAPTAPLVVAAAPTPTVASTARPEAPRARSRWQIGADMGARLRGAAGVAPDTALRVGWRRFMTEIAWQPAVDLNAEGRPLRVEALALAMGVEWPGWRSDRVRLSVPLSALVERLTVQRLDVPSAAHTLWQGGARAGVRAAFQLTGGWFIEGNLDGRVTPIGRIQVVDGPELSFNQLGARMGLGLVFLPGQ